MPGSCLSPSSSPGSPSPSSSCTPPFAFFHPCSSPRPQKSHPLKSNVIGLHHWRVPRPASRVLPFNVMLTVHGQASIWTTSGNFLTVLWLNHSFSMFFVLSSVLDHSQTSLLTLDLFPLIIAASPSPHFTKQPCASIDNTAFLLSSLLRRSLATIAG